MEPGMASNGKMVPAVRSLEGGGAMYRDINRDRDDNGVPDWQEDENYLDEAPRGAPVGMGGCLLGLLSLATVATAICRAVGHRFSGGGPWLPRNGRSTISRGMDR
jgi:hypothetical protein